MMNVTNLRSLNIIGVKNLVTVHGFRVQRFRVERKSNPFIREFYMEKA